jgi:hypothetical protein
MNILLNISDFCPENVFFLESKENNIMKGDFIKILYSTEEFTTNGIYFDFPIQGFERKVFNNKKIVFFDTFSQNEFISQISKIENDIIELFLKNESFQNNKPHCKKRINSIQSQINNGIMKYYNYSDKVCECPKFYIKISGVWETALDIGLTYKLIEY